MKLLTRDEFRKQVFDRDNNKCVFCDRDALDAHHIIERRLFSDGGYYLNNGASVCEDHHYACEKTIISVEEVRSACGITEIVLPDHFYNDQRYDKWGNVILPTGKRLRGELYFDPGVQSVLLWCRDKFLEWVKYPRTYHVPWSESEAKDDRYLKDSKNFEGKRVIVTEKMDGENSTIYRNYVHARSTEYKPHETRTWVKQFASRFSHNIPEGWRICGENMYAVHSIKYENLKNYFLVFSIWNENNECLSWEETKEWCSLLDLCYVPLLYDGIFDEKKIKALYSNKNWGSTEGYVIRVADSFPYTKFRNNVAKFVRKDHVQTTKHWMHGQATDKNKLG